MSSSQSPRKSALFLVFVTVFIDLLGFGIVLPLLPRYGEHFGLNGWQLGVLMSSFSAMQFVFAPLWGRVSDRVGRRPVLLLGLAGSTISYAMFGVATSLGSDETLLGLHVVPWLYISRIGAGIAGATISTAQAYIADVTGPKERARGMALIGAAFGLGFTFGPLVGAGFLPAKPEKANAAQTEARVESAASDDNAAADMTAIDKTAEALDAKAVEQPSAMPGYIAAVLSGLAFVCALGFLPESLQPGAAPEEKEWLSVGPLLTAFSRPGIALLLGTIFVTTFAFGQFETTLSLLTKSLGYSDRQNYLMYAYIGFTLAVAQGLLVRRMLPKWGEFRMGLSGTVVMVIGLLAIGYVASQTVKYGPVKPDQGLRDEHVLLMIAVAVCAVGFAMLNPSMQSLLSRRSSQEDQGGILGVGQSMSALARILGPLVGLSLRDYGLPLPYYVGGGVMIFGALIVVMIGPEPTALETTGSPGESPVV